MSDKNIDGIVELHNSQLITVPEGNKLICELLGKTIFNDTVIEPSGRALHITEYKFDTNYNFMSFAFEILEQYGCDILSQMNREDGTYQVAIGIDGNEYLGTDKLRLTAFWKAVVYLLVDRRGNVSDYQKVMNGLSADEIVDLLSDND